LLECDAVQVCVVFAFDGEGCGQLFSADYVGQDRVSACAEAEDGE
jgi:hypothetical protein